MNVYSHGKGKLPCFNFRTSGWILLFLLLLCDCPTGIGQEKVTNNGPKSGRYWVVIRNSTGAGRIIWGNYQLDTTYGPNDNRFLKAYHFPQGKKYSFVIPDGQAVLLRYDKRLILDVWFLRYSYTSERGKTFDFPFGDKRNLVLTAIWDRVMQDAQGQELQGVNFGVDRSWSDDAPPPKEYYGTSIKE